jgi:hypothetical protein
MPTAYTSTARLLPDEATASEGISAWIDIENTCEAFLRASLRQEIGPTGDLDAAYQKWYDRYADDKSNAFVKMCENFSRRQKSHG